MLKYDQISELYTKYKENDQPAGVDCSDLHSPTAECCAYEYMEQWNSACLVMDELKESKCLAYENTPNAVPLLSQPTITKAWSIPLNGFFIVRIL